MIEQSKLKLKKYVVYEKNYCSQSPDFKVFHSVAEKSKAKILFDMASNLGEDIKMVENVALEL